MNKLKQFKKLNIVWFIVLPLLMFSLIALGVLTHQRSVDHSSSSSVGKGTEVDKVYYDKYYSEYAYLRSKATRYENYLAYWVSTYIGKVGNKAQNTKSLIVNGLDAKGKFTSLDNLYVLYPTLNGVVSSVSVSYYYDKDNESLVQSVEVERSTISDSKTVFVTYDKNMTVTDYWVSSSSLGGG